MGASSMQLGAHVTFTSTTPRRRTAPALRKRLFRWGVAHVGGGDS